MNELKNKVKHFMEEKESEMNTLSLHIDNLRGELRTEAVPMWRRTELESDEVVTETKILLLAKVISDLASILIETA